MSNQTHNDLVTVYAIDGLKSATGAIDPVSDLEANRLYSTIEKAESVIQKRREAAQAHPELGSRCGIDISALRAVPYQTARGNLHSVY